MLIAERSQNRRADKRAAAAAAAPKP